MKTRNLLYLSIIPAFFVSCKEDATPKPDSYLSLEYPEVVYEKYQGGDCGFNFEKNKFAVIHPEKNCAFKIDYPKMKASIYINYKPVENNLTKLLKDAQKLTYNHTIKADDIQESIYEHPEKKVYGMFYRVIGNAATNLQFYATDSTRNFVTGTLYFYAKPNFDSIYPATKYIEADMQTILETLEWTNK
ncbi:gliding motility lipoprotein GldD [Flavobacterium sp. xlx-214]|uniref:gliding motility lipoprotein GldD n=1 Tax=unclassified Flavobacterium TaxID=196869 RepID=UPI0013D8578B|nr:MULTISPECIES: gliding motility lipoprotein GldD [unclassified Flavobacterium]MBA5793888.1 gliding motility lipoprotein GldD [Flavobacterium sp. xlx-221]QMI84811.1 gliding motility lipoprotein GldD [Flavobacterium sp. xlx-214]